MEYIRVTKENIENEHICCAISNMFRCFLKLPGKERFRFRQPDWKRKKKHRMLRHRLQPMHCFIMENTLRMSR